MQLQLLATTPVVSVSYDADYDWLYLDWRGDLTLAAMQEGCLAVAQCFLHANYVRVLCDNTNVTSSSPEVVSWLATEFLPYMRLTAVEYIAWTYSPNLDTKAQANTAFQQVDGPLVAMFDDLESAYTWLRGVKFQAPGLLAALPPYVLAAKERIRSELEATLNQPKQK